MHEKRRVRPFIFLFLLLIASLLLTSTLAAAQVAYSGEAPGAADKPLDETTEDGQWVEIGSGSASRGGISDSGYADGPSLAISPDGTPIIAWSDYSTNKSEIYVRRWNGTSWVAIGSGSASGGGISNSGYAGGPSLAVSPDGTPIVAWNDDSSGDSDIYVRRWSGTSWVEMSSGSASGGGISDTGGTGSPSLAISSAGLPIIAWSDGSSGEREIYVRRWNGTSWVEIGSGSASGGGISDCGGSESPSLAVSLDGTPIIAWDKMLRGTYETTYEIYVRRWNGTSWVEIGSGSASGGGISNDSGDSESPSLAISPDGTPFIAWSDRKGDWDDEEYEIYLRRWDGKSWVEMGSGSASGGGISESGRYSMHPSLAVGPDGTPIIAWREAWGPFNLDIYVRRWDGTSWVEMGSGSASGGGISNDSGGSESPSLAISRDSIPTVAWLNELGSVNEVYVRRWQPSFVSPVADFSASPTSGLSPLQVEFTNLSTGDFDECIWDFGNGVTKTICDDPSSKYRSEGNYTVSLTVKGPGGEDTITKSDYIMVYGPPTPDFSASPTSGLPPLQVNFTNLSTGEFDECIWDFGNGRIKTSCDNPSTIYRTEGDYTVSLTVKGPGGEDTKTIEDYIKAGYYQVFLPGVLLTK